MNIEPVREVIRVLYNPNTSPQEIQQAQENIISFQKLDSGWDLGQQLLDQLDPQEQFIGALTFSVKIHNEEANLPPQIHDILISKLRQALERNYAQFVVLKLFTTIITLYVRTFSKWDSFLVDIHSILQVNLPLELVFFEELMTTYTQGFTGSPQLRAALAHAIPSLLEIIQVGLATAPIEALATYNVWCSVFGSDFEVLLPRVFNFLDINGDEQVFEKCCEVLTDLYLANSRAWQKPQKNALIRQVLQCTQPFDWERTVPLGRLALAICSNDILTKDMIAAELLPYITILTNNSSMQDDEMLAEVLEFWSEFAENIVSSGMSSDYNSIFLEVVQTYWRRIQLHDNMPADTWEKLSGFRRDYCDFLELVYPLLGRELFAVFATNILGSLELGDPQKYQWYEIEASLCCLSGLADIIDESGTEYGYIEQVFSSRLWQDLGVCQVHRIRHTAVTIIGAYDSFFETPKGSQTLSTALTFLFGSLTNSSLQLTASRSIQKLCSSCRSALTGEIFNFLQVYEPLRFNLESVAHQRTVVAIGNVIEALPLASQPEPLWRLIMLVENSEMQPQDVIKCISSIGKALQKQKDEHTPELIAEATQFWDKDPNGIRQNLLELVNQAFSMGTDIFEELCIVFKVGLSEYIPNPFSFSPQLILEFLGARKQQEKVDDYPAILNLAGFLISTRAASKQLTPEIVLGATDLIDSKSLSQSMELLDTVVSVVPEIFSQLPKAYDYIRLALDALGSNDRFVLQQSSKFWGTVVSEPEFTPLVHEIGLELMNRVALQISGEAERSEVVYFSDVIRKLISKHMKFSSTLLKKAFIDDPTPRNLKKQDEKARSTFVSQLLLLRGSSQTKGVVSKFWMFCRGLPEY